VTGPTSCAGPSPQLTETSWKAASKFEPGFLPGSFAQFHNWAPLPSSWIFVFQICDSKKVKRRIKMNQTKSIPIPPQGKHGWSLLHKQNNSNASVGRDHCVFSMFWCFMFLRRPASLAAWVTSHFILTVSCFL
jgi:hypothetical protein